MDRISALRNLEDALESFEDGETDLEGLERDVRGILRTYATEFEGELAAYRVTSPERMAGAVVMATGEPEARERVRSLFDGVSDGAVDVGRIADVGAGQSGD
ncbi:hypothetical protein SAMN05216388_1004167 [Halorientalis persicus]|uniref:Uncharacterized protein n=1 Tax=Halorientalis persicus TaxID=1367881 RepID=A0A1H8IHI3_9EURY|nr:hypothetical protein [Halorientalis persicus]SEN67821.1 hypothetical protein SAMN05216388_1004167 [Halorientalis persicus]